MMYSVDMIRAEYDRLDLICGVDTSGVEVVISERLTSGHGFCICRRDEQTKMLTVRKIAIAAHLANEARAPEFWATVRHEYAHAVAAIRDPKKKHGHDATWKAICREVGCSPNRLAEETKQSLAYREANGKYKVQCTNCGTEGIFMRATKAVKSISAGRKHYQCTACGSTCLRVQSRIGSKWVTATAH